MRRRTQKGSEQVFETLAWASNLIGAETAQRLARGTIRDSGGDVVNFRDMYARQAAKFVDSITGTNRRDLDLIELVQGEPLEDSEIIGLDQLVKVAGEPSMSRSGELGKRVLIRVKDYGGYGFARVHRLGQPKIVTDVFADELTKIIKALPPDAEIVGEPNRWLMTAMREPGRIVMRDVNSFLAEPVRAPRPVRVLFVASRDPAIVKKLYPGQATKAVADAARAFGDACGNQNLIETAKDLHVAVDQARAEGRTAIIMFDHQAADHISFGRPPNGGRDDVVQFKELGDHVVPLACDFVRPGEFGDLTTDKLYLGALAGAWKDVAAKLNLDVPVGLDRVLSTFSSGQKQFEFTHA